MRISVQILLLALFALPAQAQYSTSGLDDYDRDNSNDLGMTPTSSVSLQWAEKGENAGDEVRIESNTARLTSGGTAGTKSALVDMSNLSNYPVPLSEATKTVTWAFNVHLQHSELGGFAGGETGVMFVLSGTANDVDGSANAYAVIIGSPNSEDPVQVVRFNGGYTDNGDFTVVTGGVAGEDSDYRSVRVTFDPGNNAWSLYAASGTSSFPYDDPVNVPDSDQLGSTVEDAGGPVDNSSAKFLGLHYNHGGDASVDAAFDDLHVSDPGSELPVELATFDATADGNAVHLRWTTASEAQNAGFEVQRSTERGFETIDFVDGAGTTTESTRYTYTAEDLSSGTHAFRLKQVDLDGSTSIGPERIVTLRPDGVHLATTGSNPLRKGQNAAFRLTADTEESVTVTLHDVLGRVLRTLYDGPASPEGRDLSVSTSSLSAGMYFVRVQGPSGTTTRRITIAQ